MAIKVVWNVIPDSPQALEIDLRDFEDCKSASEVEDRLDEQLKDAVRARTTYHCAEMDGYVQDILREITKAEKE